MSEKDSKFDESYDYESQILPAKQKNEKNPIQRFSIEKTAKICEFILVIFHFVLIVYNIYKKSKLSNDSIKLQTEYNILIGFNIFYLIIALLSIYGIWSQRPYLLLFCLPWNFIVGLILLMNILSFIQKGFYVLCSLYYFNNFVLLLLFIIAIILRWKCYNRIKRRKHTYAYESPPSYKDIVSLKV